jgi:hypothetical protein
VDSLSKEDKYFREGFMNLDLSILSKSDIDFSTYELCGPKVNGNKEEFGRHYLIKHGEEILSNVPRQFNALKSYLSVNDIEGIVFHHPDGRMCKIRKSDFGIKR